MNVESSGYARLIHTAEIQNASKERLPQVLRNNYIFMRHGKSTANEKGIIVSHLPNGVNEYGLSIFGQEQVKHAARTAREQDIRIDIIYTSPFLRCVETAVTFAEEYGFRGTIIKKSELKERNFGVFEGKEASNYKQVYESDRRGSAMSRIMHGAEPTEDVLKRLTKVINQFESVHFAKNILLVTHADVGEIAQAGFMGIPANLHRLHIPKFQNAELRKITSTDDYNQPIQCILFETTKKQSNHFRNEKA